MALDDEVSGIRNAVAIIGLDDVLVYCTPHRLLHRYTVERRPFSQSVLLLLG